MSFETEGFDLETLKKIGTHRQLDRENFNKLKSSDLNKTAPQLPANADKYTTEGFDKEEAKAISQRARGGVVQFFETLRNLGATPKAREVEETYANVIKTMPDINRQLFEAKYGRR